MYTRSEFSERCGVVIFYWGSSVRCARYSRRSHCPSECGFGQRVHRIASVLLHGSCTCRNRHLVEKHDTGALLLCGFLKSNCVCIAINANSLLYTRQHEFKVTNISALFYYQLKAMHVTGIGSELPVIIRFNEHIELRSIDWSLIGEVKHACHA